MSALLNLGSLIFGLIAWGLPVFSLLRTNKAECKSWAVLSALSIGACSMALHLQLYEISHRVLIEDWSALADTAGPLASVSSILLIVTIVLNVAVFAAYHRARSKD